MRKMYKLRFQTKHYRAAQDRGAGANRRKKSFEPSFWKTRDVLTGGRKKGSCAVRDGDADNPCVRE
jgi:hypothetical protein